MKKSFIILLSLAVLVSVSAAEKREYRIGDTGPSGGWIFYDCDADNSSGNADELESVSCGWRYLEAAPKDMARKFIYGPYGRSFTSEYIGDGKKNTLRTANALGPGNYAAWACETWAYNGYADWFLPSSSELELMYMNLHEKGLGKFEDEWYWSSSEFGDQFAWYIDFEDGSDAIGNRSYLKSVRAIRSFI